MQIGRAKWAEGDRAAMVRAAQKGDAHAFERLLVEQKSILYRVALVHMRDATEALDMMDEAVARGWMKIHTLREPGFFNAWITRILINACNDRLRKKKHSVALDDQWDVPAPREGSEETMDLRTAVEQLSGPLHTVIVLKYFDDMTIEQVAKAMGLPLGTTKSHLHRALKRLRVIMEDEEEAP